jgi:hypothetical protein
LMAGLAPKTKVLDIPIKWIAYLVLTKNMF